jgi:Histone acetylation protein/Bromodomain
MAPSSSPFTARKRRAVAGNDDCIPPSKEARSTSTSQAGAKIARGKRLARLVSQDNFNEEGSVDSLRSISTSRSVSDFDHLASNQCKDLTSPPPLPNPLADHRVQKIHLAALRLEAELYPMRLILTRLMGHQTHNRKGLFNVPVDAKALGLLDYHLIVEKPMDLGTIKQRLHAVAYPSRQEVAEDIRLVFTNAMRYNPPGNPINEAAKELLTYFELALMNVDDGEQLQHSTEIQIPATLVATMDQVAPAVDNAEQSAKPAAGSQDWMSDTGVSTVSGPSPSQPSSASTQHGSLREVSGTPLPLSPVVEPLIIPKRTSKLPPFLPHTCGTCQGRTCHICQQGCLFHEPALMVCEGVNCGGARLRKGSMYYVTSDGHRHYCERCHTNLQAVLPGYGENDPCRYKQALMKRTNHEEIAEPWIECSSCSSGVHAICAMHNCMVHDESTYLCHDCAKSPAQYDVNIPGDGAAHERYTFVSGSDLPMPLSSFGTYEGMTADSLPECAISSFIHAKVAKCLQTSVPNAEKTVTVRVVSESSRCFTVPDVVRRHFCMARSGSYDVVSPPSHVRYRQKAITLFQKIDGMDVCIFCMYVQEYDGDDDYDSSVDPQGIQSNHAKRVYIAYIDSVEHFRPRDVRTEVYHEILVSYLATARARGYQTAHIWACPPSRGNSFVFWNHPASQRTPNQERLLQWYHGALSKAVSCGVVTDVKSLYESEFETNLAELDVSKRGRMICPPLFDGDFWIEEAVRVHDAALTRHIKVRAPTEVCVWNVTPLLSSELDPCPALQLAALVKDRVMTHPASVPFRRPVNAAALNLHNYHDIVTKPMDLGTIYAQCVIGEYQEMADVVQDVELMVCNAKRFNPVGHYVHSQAEEVLTLFHQELLALVKIWDASTGAKEESRSWQAYAGMSMSLDERMAIASREPTSVFIEDDRSMDGTRSINSNSIVSIPSSPMSSTMTASKDDDDEMHKKAPGLQKRNRRRSTNRGGRSPLDRRSSLKPISKPPKKLDLFADGPEAVLQRMVGEDYWLIEKRPPVALANKRRRSLSCASGIETSAGEEPCHKLRRQAWVGEEVSEAVRRMRTSFFTCSLTPMPDMSEAQQEKLSVFEAYSSEYDHGKPVHLSLSSPISEARHALLEFSQYRNFEFDTLRRAKYSTAMLLYHLKYSHAPGVVPSCSTCNENIQEVRWHKVKKASEKRRVTKFMKAVPPEPLFIQEELCGCCHANHSEKEEFIPIPVSLKLQAHALTVQKS